MPRTPRVLLLIESLYLAGYCDGGQGVNVRTEVLDQALHDLQQVLVPAENQLKKTYHEGTVDAGGDYQPCECDSCFESSIWNDAIDTYRAEILKRFDNQPNGGGGG